jgi:hypothetical protein
MNRSPSIKDLVRLHQAPAVSIVCPLDARRPGNEHDPAVLRELRNEAVDNVTALLQGSAADSLVARIDEALGSIDLEHPGAGVAVLVSPDVSQVIALDVPVEPRVVVGERFAIRDLVSAVSRSARARIIVLSQQKSRCFDLSGAEIVERLDFGFPVEVVPPTETDTPHRDFPLDEHEHAEAAKFVFRAVNHALGALARQDPRPLVLVGVERDLAYFDQVADLRADVAGRVHGNHQRDTPEAISLLVQPVLAEREHQQQREACDEVREAIGAHAVSGIADTWLAARTGRGHRLVVENEYCFPARLVEGELEAAPEGAETRDAVEDIVEEVIRHDGDVVFVPAGSLTDLAHIALLTRY